MQEQAHDALMRLAKSAMPPVANRAVVVIEAIAEVRRTQAIMRLTALALNSIKSSCSLDPVSYPPLTLWKSALVCAERTKTYTAASLKDLQVVSFSGEQVSDAWLQRLAGSCEGIQSLKLKKAKVTATGIEHLKRMKELNALELFYFPLDDAAPRPISEMRQLSLVRLYGTKATRDGAAKLATDLVTAKIDFRRGGFLGIGVEPHPLGCMVVQVQPKSAAEAAGFNDGDVIMSIAGERPVTSRS